MLAVNITAAKTQIAKVRLHNGKPSLLNYESFNNQEFSDFDSILSLYLRKNNLVGVSVCVGAAGPVLKNSVSVTNLSWRISAADLVSKYEFKKITIVNDLVATAHGIFYLSDDRFFSLNSGTKHDYGNIGLVAPGRGLGECLIFYDGEKFRPIASEGGHAAFAPGSPIEIDLWQYLYDEMDFVETEDVVSLPGLERIYRFLLNRFEISVPDWYNQTEDVSLLILENGLSGIDPTAEHAMHVFIDCLATEAANLALKGMTLGGIFLTGVMASQLMTMLEKGRFMERFVSRGKMGKILERIPVGIVIEDKTALIGAGSLVLDMNQ